MAQVGKINIHMTYIYDIYIYDKRLFFRIKNSYNTIIKNANEKNF